MPQQRSADDLTTAHPVELLLNGIFDHAIYMLDRNGFICSWNAGAQNIYRYTHEDAIGQHFASLFSKEDQERDVPKHILGKAALLGRDESEGWRVRKDGSRFWALAVTEAIRDGQGNVLGFAKITRDLTEKRAAQHALADSERRFRLLTDAAVDYAICMLDPSGLVTNWNAGAERIHGYQADEVLGQHFSLFYSVEERANGVPARTLEAAVRTGRFEGEGWRLRSDGGRFWAFVTVEPVRAATGDLAGFAQITRDITERRQAHEALRDSERQFRLLVAGVTDYALYMLDTNGIVSSWNAGAEKIKGYTADEIIGHHFSRFYTEPDRLSGLPFRALDEARTKGKYEAEGLRRRKDGSVFWAHVVIDPIRDERGVLIGFAKITKDITQRREAQIALEKAQAQVAYAQRMEALGQLTGGVAHDFNNLLMIIAGQAQLLKKAAGDPVKVQGAIEAIQQATKRGATLTRQMLSFSRRQALQPEAVDLKDRLHRFRDMLSSSIPATVQMHIETPPDTWNVHADANELELAIVNLIVNARDAVPNGGAITLTAMNTTLTKPSEQGLHGEFVAISVIDTGIGIPPDVLNRVVEPFFTTKAADKGTGLGLSQVYGFVHQSGGSLDIQSELGHGTRVTMYLPRSKQAIVVNADAAVMPTAAERARRALIVEDNPDVAIVTASLVQQFGYSTIVTANAAEALAAFDNGDGIEFVLSDIVLPGEKNGVALARELKEIKPDVPVILATGYNKEADQPQQEWPVLRKPYDLNDLGKALAQALSPVRKTNTANVLPFRSSR